MEPLYTDLPGRHALNGLSFAAVLLLAGHFAASAQGKLDNTYARNSATSAPVSASVDPRSYLIGPEDVLFIRVWREPDFTFPVAVRPDGEITVPLIGDVDAAGETPAELTKNLGALLGKFINNPDVSVFVTEVRSKKYYIDGEVNRPGAFPLVTRTTVLEALSHSGGFKDFANSKRIRILRGDKVYLFNLKQVSNGKHLEQNIVVQNGDHVIVP